MCLWDFVFYVTCTLLTGNRQHTKRHMCVFCTVHFFYFCAVLCTSFDVVQFLRRFSKQVIVDTICRDLWFFGSRVCPCCDSTNLCSSRSNEVKWNEMQRRSLFLQQKSHCIHHRMKWHEMKYRGDSFNRSHRSLEYLWCKANNWWVINCKRLVISRIYILFSTITTDPKLMWLVNMSVRERFRTGSDCDVLLAVGVE